MGQIRINITGSFEVTDSTRLFGAFETGHADCVARAIEYLARVVLPQAIKLDHKLHEEGHKPEFDFGRESNG